MSLSLVSLTPAQALGIPVALVGSVFLAVGAQLQQRGVAKVNDQTSTKRSLGIGQVLALARRPSWLIGTVCLGLAIVFQLFSLYLAPLTVVQPLGAVALVITAVLNARLTKVRLDAPALRAMALCVGGVGLFVAVAAVTTTSLPILEPQLLAVAIILAVVLLLLGTGFVVFRKRLTRLFYVVGAGVLFGFVATLAKVLIGRVQTIVEAHFRLVAADWLTLACVLGLLTAAILGTYFVQTAYSSGSPDVVVAGLTVIDPLVGVTIGIVVLGEAAHAPLWAGIVFVVAGALAVWGVILLSRRRPRERGDAAPPSSVRSGGGRPPA
ncbi:multidrug DMT transporter permease [Leifsonia sp. Leaf336]|uniref:DMT family transporter n=1 Tax=Leifsonia sp. Leaf336 TaxID=1736341 RepID=UPI0006F62A49|nr:DMT family transporter [Leifsonia sp. Leaf336]KQR50821.1 multidrug DMT transporter permease [Leifsonia sp. Leaf336]